MNLTRQPVTQKAPQFPSRPDYLAAVRELPCCICDAFGEPQMSATTAHHPIHGRASQRKRPDVCAIPLCDGHHQGLWDNSKVAVHRDPAEWKARYGPDTDWIAVTQDKLAHLLADRAGNPKLKGQKE